MNYATLPALLAILGQKSAHSLATGPVIADPFISPLGLTITPALSEDAKCHG